MKLLKGRAMTYLSLGLVFVIFLLILLSTIVSSKFSSDVENKSVYIEGEYQIDAGEWHKTLPGVMVHSEFTELTVKGKLSRSDNNYEMLIISATDAWLTLKADGREIASNQRDDNGPFRNTPGYSILYVPVESITNSDTLELNLYYPYHMLSNKNLSDVCDMYVGDESTVYELLFQHKTLTIIFCLLICFFGLFAFPIAGIVLGKIDYRYLAFAVLCFFSGVFILSQSIYSYLPLWIPDPVLCMTICTVTNYLCMIAALVYIKVNLTKPANKIIGNIAIISAAMLTALALILHYTGVSDLHAGKPFMLIFVGVCAIILTGCMLSELQGSKEALAVLASWIPMVTGLLLDIVNSFFFFTSLPLFEIGAALTLINQLVILVIDLRRQYKESLRYQQMQKELYEAKVSLMVSQIQPHFLYNALTSIAMMCTKDPQTAKNATINFADYLRGNMNSLKQRTPVPFTQELEHLKKYLMLEKLRFRDLLNIEYDIQVTDFVIPQLSVQPLVENAVKHGVGMKEDGGTVTIATRETDTAYEVIITDNGVGFDTSKPPQDDGRSHVGMENVKQRLQDLCNADVIIESEIGKGTSATIRIPKKDEETT